MPHQNINQTRPGRLQADSASVSGVPSLADVPQDASETAESLGRTSLWETYSFRRLLRVLVFAVTLIVCRWLAFQLRFDFDVPPEHQVQLERYWFWVVALQLSLLGFFGQFTGVYRYFSVPDIQRLAYGIGVSGAFLFLIRFVFGAAYSPPKGEILAECMLSFLALGAIRTGWRVLHEKYYSGKHRVPSQKQNVAIFGAGDAGASLLRELTAHPHLGLDPMAFFDDDRQKWQSSIHGVRVAGPPEAIRRYKKKLGIEEVVIAMPSASPKRLAELVGLLQKEGLKYVTVPGIDQLAAGKVKISQLRPVRIEDLLGREPIDLELDRIEHVLKGRVAMITGAGGSIGAELCRQVAAFKPACLLLVEQSEVQLFQIEQELIKLGHGSAIVSLIADILDESRIRSILDRYRPGVVFHAAAHKHVPMMEAQPGEAIKNNTFGTANLARLSLEYSVERFVMISTDKAVNPTSAMGASKRMAEIFLQAFAQQNSGSTKFVAVRFGNVLGSSGSVVPIFERQIAEGGPTTVTHPDVVRFFMTIPEAVGLVLQSCAQGQGGEIFVLDMGKPVKIVDLAQQMIKLSGLEPGRDIEVKFIGLRPGEKLYEELQHLHANCTTTAHPRIKRLTSQPPLLADVEEQLRELELHLHSSSGDDLKRMMKRIIPEYTPFVSGNQEADASKPLGRDGKESAVLQP